MLKFISKAMPSSNAIVSIAPVEDGKSTDFNHLVTPLLQPCVPSTSPPFVGLDRNVSREEPRNPTIQLDQVPTAYQSSPLPFACNASVMSYVFSNDGASSRKEIEDLREVCFDLWPEEMETSNDFEEAEWSDGVEPMDVDEEEKKIKAVRWDDELVVSQEFELTSEERDGKSRRIHEIHGKIDEIRFYSTPLTSFTPSLPPSLGSSKKIGREIEDLQEICFDLWPEEMETSSEDFEEAESSDLVEPMEIEMEKVKKPKLRRSKRIAALKKKSQPLRCSARIAALRKKGNM